jgi:hypothetical protein
MAKPVVLGEFATPELADSSAKMARGMGGLFPGKGVRIAVEARYMVIASRGNGASAARVTGDFTCGLHTPAKHFTSQQGLSAHRTIVHRKKNKKVKARGKEA